MSVVIEGEEDELVLHQAGSPIDEGVEIFGRGDAEAGYEFGELIWCFLFEGQYEALEQFLGYQAIFLAENPRRFIGEGDGKGYFGKNVEKAFQAHCNTIG